MWVTGPPLVRDFGSRRVNVRARHFVLRTGDVVRSRDLERGSRHMVIADVLDELRQVIRHVHADGRIGWPPDVHPFVALVRVHDVPNRLTREAYFAIV